MGEVQQALAEFRKSVTELTQLQNTMKKRMSSLRQEKSDLIHICHALISMILESEQGYYEALVKEYGGVQ